jgi:pilus assembly protein CpaE
VREVVKADDLGALSQACQESLAVSQQLRGGLREPAPSSHDKATLITVFSAKGGCGKTTMATNMAAAAARAAKRTCLVDLDLAFGDVAIALQLYPERGIADVVAMQGGIDRKGVSSLVTPHSERLDTVLAPVEPGAAETISAEMIASLLSVLKDMYDVVVVDTPPLFNDHVLAAFDASDHLALVTTLDIPALKNLKLTLETLELLGYSRDRWHVILNRADAKVGLSVDDVTTTLHMQIAAQVPSSRAVPSAINRGVAIVQDSPGHPVSTALRRLTEALLANGQGAAGRPRRHRSLGRRRRAAEVST